MIPEYHFILNFIKQPLTLLYTVLSGCLIVTFGYFISRMSSIRLVFPSLEKELVDLVPLALILVMK